MSFRGNSTHRLYSVVLGAAHAAQTPPGRTGPRHCVAHVCIARATTGNDVYERTRRPSGDLSARLICEWPLRAHGGHGDAADDDVERVEPSGGGRPPPPPPPPIASIAALDRDDDERARRGGGGAAPRRRRGCG